MGNLRIYLDTSVIGGCFDLEFSKASNALFSAFNSGIFVPVISAAVVAELEQAPEKVKKKIKGLPKIEVIPIGDEVKDLAKKYLKAGIVSSKYAGDALHIAAATVTCANVLVSWNFKHIVNLSKIQGFNSVNAKSGYGSLEIRTPEEVIYD